MADSQNPTSGLLEPDVNIGEEDRSPELSPATTGDIVRSVSHEDIFLDCDVSNGEVGPVSPNIDRYRRDVRSTRNPNPVYK